MTVPIKGGQPMKWNDPNILRDKIDNYFNSISRTEPLTELIKIGVDDKGKNIFERVDVIGNDNKPIMHRSFKIRPTVSGLCLALDCDRKTLWEYEETRPEFSNIIKTAKMIIADYLENNLYNRDSATGAIFNLKCNFKWIDQPNQQQQPNNNQLNINNYLVLPENQQIQFIDNLYRIASGKPGQLLDPEDFDKD
jgi:hypothetical protein